MGPVKTAANLSAPEPIRPDHDLALFDCGAEPSLNEWLKKRALANHSAGASRTYVVCDGSRVVAYYCLASGAVRAAEAPGRVRRNMPDPIPVVILGRLAVDRAWQGHQIGAAMLRDAALRTISAARTIGIRAMLIHAISDSARAFYLRYGFVPSPADPMLLMATIQDLANAFNHPV